MTEKPKFGQKIIRLEQVNSTNLFAKELYNYINPIHDGTLILSYNQYSGKGRKNKEWISEKGKNISMSLIVFPMFLNSSQIFYISKSIALGISDYLISLGISDVKIKWPNDIYVENCKVAGILIENTWKGNQLQESIVGIGLNVNQTDFKGLNRDITSLKLLKKEKLELDDVVKNLLEYLEIRYQQLLKMNFLLIDDDYRINLYMRNREIDFYKDNSQFKGKILDVDSTGKLIIDVKENGIKTFDLDEIEFTQIVQ